MKTIDAQNKKLGRIASEAAIMLMGKDSAQYQSNTIPDDIVHITNAAKMDLSEKKLKEKKYTNYTGYQSGLSYIPISKVLKEKGYQEVFKKAVRGMLPANKLRPLMLKNLKITE